MDRVTAVTTAAVLMSLTLWIISYTLDNHPVKGQNCDLTFCFVPCKKKANQLILPNFRMHGAKQEYQY